MQHQQLQYAPQQHYQQQYLQGQYGDSQFAQGQYASGGPGYVPQVRPQVQAPRNHGNYGAPMNQGNQGNQGNYANQVNQGNQVNYANQGNQVNYGVNQNPGARPYPMQAPTGQGNYVGQGNVPVNLSGMQPSHGGQGNQGIMPGGMNTAPPPDSIQGPGIQGPGYQGGPGIQGPPGNGQPSRRRPPAFPQVPEGRRVVTSPTLATDPAALSWNRREPDTSNSSPPAVQPNSASQPNLAGLRTKSLSSTTRPPGFHAAQRTGSSSSTVSSSTAVPSKSRSFSSLGKLSSLSMKKFASLSSLSKTERVTSTSTLASQKTIMRKPVVYPAILSRVALAFKDHMVLAINMKDGLEYHDTFTGKAAVDVICNLIRTNDRNLALLLGRSLDAQKFFHDVTYNHRLRDSKNEVYTFSRVYSDVEYFQEDNNASSHRSSLVAQQSTLLVPSAPYPTTNTIPSVPSSPIEGISGSFTSLNKAEEATAEVTGVNGVFTILTDCYSPTCTRNHLCYSIACPRRLEQQARLNLKPRGGLKRAVSKLSLHDNEPSKAKTLWHETVDQSVLDKLDKQEKMRQELIYELIYTERDYLKDLEFMTEFYIMPLRNPSSNIIPDREREAFIRTVFGGVNNLLRLSRSLSEALTARQQSQKPVIETIGDVFLQFVGNFDPFMEYSGNKVFASYEHERQQQVNFKYARFLEATEKRPESRKQDLSSFLIKGVQRPARYQLLLSGILKNTKETSPDYKNLVQAKEEIHKVLAKINIQTGESTDRYKVMVLHKLLGRQTLEERFNFKLTYNNRITYQVTLSRKRDNEKIDLYLFEHALLLVKHKVQNKREVYKVFERPVYLPLLFINSGFDSPTFKTILNSREECSIVSDASSRNRVDSSPYNPVATSQQRYQVNFFGLGTNAMHVSLFADDLLSHNQLLLQVLLQQRKLIEKYDIFSLSKYETRRFTGNNKINCGVPCYGGKKLLYGTDSGVWVSTVRSISMTSNQKICSDPTLVISKSYVTQMEVLVEYNKLLVLADKTLYEFDLSCTDSLDHAKNTRSGKIILNHVLNFKTGVCVGRLLICAVKAGSSRAISIVEPTNPFDAKAKNKNKRLEVKEISFTSDPILISFLKTKLCIGCTKGFEIVSLEAGRKEPILDEADPSLDFATQRESVTPLAIHRIDKNFLLSYSEFSFLINQNGWRTKQDWGIFWEGSPQSIALFYPYLLAFDPGFIEIRDLESTTLIRALVGENIRFLHSNEHEALYACDENGYDIIVLIDFLNLKPKPNK